MADWVTLEIWSLQEAMRLVAHRGGPIEVVVARAISVNQAPALLKILELKADYGFWEVEGLPRLKAVVRLHNILNAAIEGYMPYLANHPNQNACLSLLHHGIGLLLDAAADASLSLTCRGSILSAVQEIQIFVQESRSRHPDPILLVYLHVRLTGVLDSLMKSTVLLPREENAAGAPAAPHEEEADDNGVPHEEEADDNGVKGEEMAQQVPLEIWSLQAAMDLIANHPEPLVVVVTRSVSVYQAPGLLNILEQKMESDNWRIQELPRLQALVHCNDILSALFEGFMPLIVNNFEFINLFEEATWLLHDTAAHVSSTFHQLIIGAVEKLQVFMEDYKSSPPDSQILHILMRALIFSLMRATVPMPPQEENAPVVPQA